MIGFLVGCASISALHAQQTESTDGLVPQNLLKLIHAPEVQTELQFDAGQVRGIEELFAAIDGDWFRSRIAPVHEQYAIVAGLEGQVWRWMDQHATEEQTQRLRELQYRSQGVRMLLGKEVSEAIELDAQQRKQFQKLAREVNEASAELAKASAANAVTESLKEALKQATEREQAAVQKLLTPLQLTKVTGLLGKGFDTQGLERIYPMAPELIAVDEWINSKPLTLRSLRGKVVLVHFYAFQCHNCHANLPHYTKWHQEFANKDVVVLGIQTPETAAERDPSRVRAAAQEKQIEYPVAIDLASSNWKAWGNTMWPTVYLIDKQGYLRYWWQGELNWQGATGDQLIRDMVVRLLDE